MTLAISSLDPLALYADQKKFDCEHALINKFVAGSLRQQVAKKLSAAFVLVDTELENKFVGFYTCSMASVDRGMLASLSKGSLPHQVPCVRIGMLGIDKRYKNQQLGSRLLRHAIVNMVATRHIGCYGMTLDADAAAVDFYLKNGFTLLEERKDPNPTPMFLHIETAIQSIE